MGSDERLDELLLRWEELAEGGQEVSIDELCCDCPELIDELRRRIDGLREVAWLSDLRVGPQEAAGANVSLTANTEPVPGYRLLRRLGRGGFGEVWEAIGPDGPVAMKFVAWTDKGAAVEWRALDVIKGIRHQNLLANLGFFRSDEWLIVAMELADRTLLDRWGECREQGLPGIPAEELLDYFRQAARGIDHLHERHIQHRDIKPHNLLLKGCVLKVADFGLARVLAHSLTGHTGSLTLAFAAPEFFDGKTARTSDQYSLAMSYCQLRGGKLPFEGTPAQLVAAHLARKPDLSMVPEEERPALLRALAKQPEARWPSCSAFVEALAGEAQMDTLPLSARRSRRRWVVAGLAGLCLLVAVLVWMLPREKQVQGSPTRREQFVSPQIEPSRGGPKEATNLAFVFDGKSRIVTPVERFAPVTLECWVRPERTLQGRVEKYLIGSDVPTRSGISLAFAFRERQGPPILGVQLLPAPTERGIDIGVPLPLDTWSHVAAVFGAKQTTVFLDGKRVGQGAPSANVGGTPFVIGNAGKDNPDHYFVGQMRAVRISRGERYVADFTAPTTFRPDESTVLLYDAAKTRGTTALDLSGKGNHGLMRGVTTRVRPE
jgi:serine/threonine protein kinase